MLLDLLFHHTHESVVFGFASLGGEHKHKRVEEKAEAPNEIIEPLPVEYISRIRNEFLSEAMAKDLINRAKQRKSRAEEEALLLIL